MTEQQLADLERLANAATPGPWEAQERGHPLLGYDIVGWQFQAGETLAGDRGMFDRKEDADFVAAMCPEVAKHLVAAVREKDAEIARLREQIAGHCERIAKQSDLLSRKAERTEGGK